MKCYFFSTCGMIYSGQKVLTLCFSFERTSGMFKEKYNILMLNLTKQLTQLQLHLHKQLLFFSCFHIFAFVYQSLHPYSAQHWTCPAAMKHLYGK